MAINMLPDLGAVAYDTVTFDVLKHTKITGTCVYDSSGRTVKYMTYKLEVEGVIVLPDGSQAKNTNTIWQNIRQVLTHPGKGLRYIGRGFGDVRVNVAGFPVRDVNWGPKPNLLYFQPLGGGLSAIIRWEVEFSIPECHCLTSPRSGGTPQATNRPQGSLLEFTYDSNVSYDEDGYAQVILSGTLEIPLTWGNNTRQMQDTVDIYRQQYLNNPPTIDDFKVTGREFKVDKNKKIIEWSYSYAEMAPMGIPFSCTSARGSISVKPEKPIALMPWVVSLRASYVVRKDFPRRHAFLHFMILMMDRISACQFADTPEERNNQQQPNGRGVIPRRNPQNIPAPTTPPAQLFTAIFREIVPVRARTNATVVILTFGYTEGLYEDSREVSFEATWRLVTNFGTIMPASGVWLEVTSEPRLSTDTPWDTDKTIWRTKMADLSGWKGTKPLTQQRPDDLVVDICVCDSQTNPTPPHGFPVTVPARRNQR
jgi:hypothetical protein